MFTPTKSLHNAKKKLNYIHVANALRISLVRRERGNVNDIMYEQKSTNLPGQRE
jgi:hypothetical protein